MKKKKKCCDTKQLTCSNSLSKGGSDWEFERFSDNKLTAEASDDTLGSSVAFPPSPKDKLSHPCKPRFCWAPCMERGKLVLPPQLGLLPKINWGWWGKETQSTACYSGKFNAPPGDWVSTGPIAVFMSIIWVKGLSTDCAYSRSLCCLLENLLSSNWGVVRGTDFRGSGWGQLPDRPWQWGESYFGAMFQGSQKWTTHILGF